MFNRSVRRLESWRRNSRLGPPLPITTSASIYFIMLMSACQSSPAGPSVPGTTVEFPDFEDRIESWRGKTVMVVTPHPDDDTFGCGGTLALLAAGGNKIIVVIYTNDDKGSRDPAMTSERLAQIRRREEENACEIVGIPKENIIWLGHGDGMLEYVDAELLTKQVAREIRRYRPDGLFSIDPGRNFKRWHKSDHNAGAFITVDAIRAARWRLYFPELEQEGLKAYSVPVCYMYYSTQPNYKVDIHDVAEKKLLAAAAHESQWDPYIDKYAPMTDAVRASLIARLRERARKENGRIVEYFRRAEY